MNTKQLAALWVGILLGGAMLLFPPHHMEPTAVEIMKSQLFEGQPKPQYTQYALIFAPPPASVGVDWGRLAPPLLFVGLITFGMITSLQNRPDASHRVLQSSR